MNFREQSISIEFAKASVPSNIGTMPVLNTLGITSAILLLLTGVVLLYGPVLRQDANQTAQLLGGATLVAFGLMTILLIVRNWLGEKMQHRNVAKRDRG